MEEEQERERNFLHLYYYLYRIADRMFQMLLQLKTRRKDIQNKLYT